MKHARILAAAALVGGLAVAVPAQADPYKFVITGDYTATFFVDSHPTPDDFTIGSGFILWDQPGFPDALLGVADLTFYSAGNGGGFAIDDFYGDTNLLLTDGSQLYTGPESSPTFRLGTFALTEYLGSGTYSLTISSAAVAGVPEPATWTMMILGFGAIGGTLRRRQYNNAKTKVAFAV